MYQFILQNLTTALFVLAYSYVFIFLPGHALARRLNWNRLDTLALSLVAGFSLFSVITYLVRFARLPFFVSELLLLVLVLATRTRLLPRRLPRPNRTQSLFFLVALLAAVLHSAVLIRSALPNPQGLAFVDLSFHDSMQHLSLIRRLHLSSDLAHPGFSGASLVNYHYLIDLSLAAVTRFSFVSLWDTYYRLYPLAVSVIFSLSVFAFTRRYTRNEPVSVLAVIFSLAAGNASYFARFIRGPEFSWGSNTFIMNPLIDLLQNPASIFVLAQLLLVLMLLASIPQPGPLTRPTRLAFILLLAVTSGTMIGFKAWGGAIILPVLASLAIWQFLTRRRLTLLAGFTLAVLAAAAIFLPHYRPETSASPVWAPGWTLHRLVNDADRWNRLDSLFIEEYYQNSRQPVRLAGLYAKWFAIYLVGNYWLRLLGFAAILALATHPRQLTPDRFAILAITLLSFSLPLFFNQGRMAYDIEQFNPYALLLASIFTVIVLDRAARRLPRRLAPVLFLALILVSFPSNTTSLKARTTGDTHTVTSQELAAYREVERLTGSQDLVILYPSHRNVSTLEFAAFTNRNTFFSGRTLSVITGADTQTRHRLLEEAFGLKDPNRIIPLLRQYSITHLFLYREDYQYLNLDPLPLSPVFANSSATLFEVN